MLFGSDKVSIEGVYTPINTNISHDRIAEVAGRLDILARAAAAGQKEEPPSADADLDENHRVIIAESEGFVSSGTRRAAAEISDRAGKIRELMPVELGTALEQANIRRLVAEARDTFKDELDRANAEWQRTYRALRAFEEKNGLNPLSADGNEDKAMFVASLGALTLGEGIFNAWSFVPMQDQGLAGGLLLAMSASAANIVMGLGCGYLGWRLMGHKRWDYKLLGSAITGLLMTAGWALHLALGNLRDAITTDPNARIDFLLILTPSRWFSYSGIAPFVLVAIGVATFVIAGFKGRGGQWGVCPSYWGHEVYDRPFRKADRALEDAKANLRIALMNAFDGERAELRKRHIGDTAHLSEIRGLVGEAEKIERTLSDSIRDEIGRSHIWQRMYRDRNRAVRMTPAPRYFDSYLEFEEWRAKRLDLSELKELARRAEEVLAKNTANLAAVEDKVVQEQTAAIDGVATIMSASERRAVQLADRDDGGPKARSSI